MTDTAQQRDWSRPAATAIPKEGYLKLEQGRYGPIFPKTPANYGFTLIAKIKPGREEAIRAYGKTIENAIAGNPSALAPLRLHYLRWKVSRWIGRPTLRHSLSTFANIVTADEIKKALKVKAAMSAMLDQMQ